MSQELSGSLSAFFIRNRLQDGPSSLSYQSQLFNALRSKFGSYLSLLFFALLVTLLVFLASVSTTREFTRDVVPVDASRDHNNNAVAAAANASAVTIISSFAPSLSPVVSPFHNMPFSDSNSTSSNTGNGSSSNSGHTGNWSSSSGGNDIIAIPGEPLVVNPTSGNRSDILYQKNQDDFLWFTLVFSFFVWVMVMNVLRCLKERYSRSRSSGGGDEYYQTNGGQQDLGFLLRMVQLRNGQGGGNDEYAGIFQMLILPYGTFLLL
jgi:hypothetical protein